MNVGGRRESATTLFHLFFLLKDFSEAALDNLARYWSFFLDLELKIPSKETVIGYQLRLYALVTVVQFFPTFSC